MKMRVLIVDDKEDNVELICDILEDRYEYLKAYSGLGGLKLAVEGKPDLILLDVQMPDLNGFEVIRELKMDDRTRSIPVIFVTARFRDIDRIVKGLELGAFDYLTKPVEDEVPRTDQS